MSRLKLPKLSNAIFECELVPGVALWDVSHLMPRKKWKQKSRDASLIDRLFVHHSGALGAPGVFGAYASARYVVTRRKFPGAAYTFWIPASPLFDLEGRLVVLRLNPDSERSWHTGRAANDRGVAAVFQGNKTKKDLTPSQKTCGEALLEWAPTHYPRFEGQRWLSRHSDAAKDGGRNKKQCPGSFTEAWLNLPPSAR